MRTAILVMAMMLSCDQVDYSSAVSFASPDAEPLQEHTTDNVPCLRGVLPDYSCTPGAVMTTDMTTICYTSTKTRRHVNRDTYIKVYREYGVPYPQDAGMYELDHLIPLELGGSNDINNLWLESAEPRPGFHEKDMVENYLHAQVCSGAMTLQEAQTQIRTNWLSVYQRITATR